jgi:hypothetical protein
MRDRLLLNPPRTFFVLGEIINSLLVLPFI